MATLDVFKDLVGATVGKTDAQLNRFLGYAATRLGADAFDEWGVAYEQALVYLAGHLLARADLGASGTGSGAVTSESAGGMSRAYGTPGGGLGPDAELMTTAPGADFVALRKATIAPVYGMLPDTTYALR